MVDFVSLGTGLKTAYELARYAKDVNDQAKVNVAIADIMDQLTSAQFSLFEMQQQHQALIDENRQLHEELEQQQRFEQYRLEWTGGGYLIMSLKDEHVTDDQPSHAICPRCKEDDRLSVMNFDGLWYSCTSCKYCACAAK